MKQCFAIILLGALAAGAGVTGGLDGKPGQTAAATRAPATTPTVDHVLDKYVQAIGGRAAVERLTSRVTTGSIEAPASGDAGSIVPGTIEVFQKAPNKRMTIINFPGSGGDQRGFNGTAGWYIDPDEGPKDLSGSDLAALKLESEFDRSIRLKELFPKMSIQGQAKVSGHETYVVAAPHEDGSIERMYFDTQSGLLIRDEVPVEVPDEGKTTVVNDFDDYREVDSVKLPFSVRQTSPDFEYIIKFTSIKHNVPIDDSKFNKPAASNQ